MMIKNCEKFLYCEPLSIGNFDRLTATVANRADAGACVAPLLHTKCDSTRSAAPKRE